MDKEKEGKKISWTKKDVRKREARKKKRKKTRA